MHFIKTNWHKVPRPFRRVIVLITGSVLIVAGVFMLAIPGPGWATIFLGLALLATEFERAERLRSSFIRRFKQTIERVRKNKHK